MASIDIFNNSAFQVTGLTAAIETAPYKPRLLGSLGIFEQDSIRTTTAFVDRKQNKIRILNTANRGTMRDVRSSNPRTAIPLIVPHVPYYQTIIADDIQNIRAFGSESELESVAKHVNVQLRGMRDDHEVTHEYHRVGALKGQVLDGDATTVLYNFYTLFGVSQTTVAWYSTDISMAPTITGVIRLIADKLGADVPDRIVALCGNSYFDALTQHPSMLASYDRWRDGEFKRESYIGKAWYRAAANGFGYQNVLFLNYRGKVGDVTFIADNEAYFFPTGIPEMFKEVAAPADFMETVNTLGKKVYAKQQRMPFDKGVELHTQSNVLTVCTRPDLVIKSTWAEEEA